MLSFAHWSITLLGFVSVFFIFRYQRIDTYIDNKRPVLRELLHDEIQENPEVLVRIESIGRARADQDLQFFSQVVENHRAGLAFVVDIIKLAEWRQGLKRQAMYTILYLGGIVPVFVLAHLLAERVGVAETTLSWGGLVIFLIGLGLTLWLLYRSFGQGFTRRARHQ